MLFFSLSRRYQPFALCQPRRKCHEKHAGLSAEDELTQGTLKRLVNTASGKKINTT